jgi:hypothetical protein
MREVVTVIPRTMSWYPLLAATRTVDGGAGQGEVILSRQPAG